MMIDAWARRWDISVDALIELNDLMGVAPVSTSTVSGSSENAAQQSIKLDAPNHGARLWRNNVGAMQDDSGRVVRFGLANESKAINKIVKSSDLIGIRPVLIDSHHVGMVIGQFVSIEVKRPKWVYKSTNREMAQLSWIKLIVSMGGLAQFATSPENVRW